MNQCWEHDQLKRPTFNDLLEKFNEKLDDFNFSDMDSKKNLFEFKKNIEINDIDDENKINEIEN
jgi:hypothetical protein